MDKEELLALAERCEAATGHDYALNVEIFKAVHPEYADYVQGRGGLVHPYDGSDQRVLSDVRPGNYTASIDSAMTLVPTKLYPDLRPGTWWWSVDTLGCDAHVAYENRDTGIPEFSGQAATPALALCAAALRAQADL